MPAKLSQFWKELKRRRVHRMMAIYAGSAYVIFEASTLIFPRWGLPDWTIDLVLYLLILGAVIAAVVSWVFDITAEGIERTEPLKKDQPVKQVPVSAAWKAATYASLVVIIGLLVWDVSGLRKHMGSGAAVARTILVLPFDDYSPGRDQEYFCDGMTEELIADLARIHDILVKSRNTAMSFKGTALGMREIAQKTDARYILEGSVRKDGNRLRITAQLIDTDSDTHLWAENYNGTLDDVFDIQVKVSRAIANALRIKLSPDESSSISERGIDDPGVYEYYLKARQELYRFSEEGLVRAIQYLEKGLEAGGENQLLYSLMGNVYFQYWNLGIRVDHVYLEKAKACAGQIFEMEPGSHHGSMILGLLQAFTDPPEAIREFEFVLEKDPTNEDALLWLSSLCLHLGLIEKAEPLVRELVKKDPLNSIVQVLPALTLYFQRDFEAARVLLEDVYATNKSDVVRWHYAKTLASCGHSDEAIHIFDQCADLCGSGFDELSGLFSQALQHSVRDSILVISPAMERWAKYDWMMSLWLAECHSMNGQYDRAMEYLERSVELGGVNYPYLNELSFFLAGIRSGDRFQELLEEVEPRWQKMRQ